jgi:uncharacterized phage protein gp47/JayE
MATNIPAIPDYVDEQDYEYILASYLGNVRDDVDKREGSIIWDSGAPCCIEIAKAYLYLQAMMGNVFAATAHGTFLEMRCEEQGIKKDPATKAKRLGVFKDGAGQPYSVSLGTQFSTVGETNLVNFTVIEVFSNEGQTVPGSYILECTEAGVIGNQYFGEIVPVLNLNNLAEATLSDVLIPGEDEQDEEEIREEYFEVVNQKPFGGNITEYRQFVESIEGVGTCQVYPTWNGGGTVKIAIIDSSYNVPSSTLIEKVQKDVDPHYNDEYAGMGLGMAPIGHVVTVTGANKFLVNVATTVELMKGYTLEQVKPNIKTSIDNYLSSLRKDWDKSDDLNNYGLKIIIARVRGAILNTPGVENITSCTLNGEAQDIELQEDKFIQQLPILGEVTING